MAAAMRPLLSSAGLARLREVLDDAPLVAFDWDGTLVPIAVHVREARLSPEASSALRQVARRWPTAIVSGRARHDLRVLAGGVRGLTLIGNHGMEGAVKDARERTWRRRVSGWRRQLARLERVPGVEVEAKGLSLSIHYRRARDKPAVRRTVRATLQELEGARIVRGKDVVNVVPADAPNKGTAVRDLARRLRRRSILFVGDDVTDEDAFRLGRRARLLGVRVGRKATSAAEWFVPRQSQVRDLLALLARGGRPANTRATEGQ
jgi:trehalose 6-phosphate phosphatase